MPASLSDVINIKQGRVNNGVVFNLSYGEFLYFLSMNVDETIEQELLHFLDAKQFYMYTATFLDNNIVLKIHFFNKTGASHSETDLSKQQGLVDKLRKNKKTEVVHTIGLRNTPETINIDPNFFNKNIYGISVTFQLNNVKI